MPLTRITSNVIENGTIIDADISATAGIAISKVKTFTVPSSSKTFYIAPRTDGIAGTGTMLDPYDASTAAKFDALRASIPANSTIRMLSGNYETIYPASNFNFNDNVSIIGDGPNNTTLKVVGSLYGTNKIQAIAIKGNNCCVKDLKIDCNFQNLRNTIPAIGGVTFFGNNNIISNVHVINAGGAGAGQLLAECFVFFTYGEKCLIENCKATEPQANADGNIYVSVFCTFVKVYLADGWNYSESNVVRGCTAIGPADFSVYPNGVIFQASGPNSAVIEECLFKNCSVGVYSDSFIYDVTWIKNNTFENCGVSIQSNLGLDQYKQNVPTGMHIYNNKINLGPNSYGWAIYLAHGQSFYIDKNTFGKTRIGVKHITRVGDVHTLSSDVAHGYNTGDTMQLFPWQQGGVESIFAKSYTITKVSNTSFSFTQSGPDLFTDGWIFTKKTYVNAIIWMRQLIEPNKVSTPDFLNGMNFDVSVTNNIVNMSSANSILNVVNGYQDIGNATLFLVVSTPRQIPRSFKISSLTSDAGVATATTETPHYLVSNEWISIVGMQDGGYQETVQITVTGANTFTYPLKYTVNGNSTTAFARVQSWDANGNEVTQQITSVVAITPLNQGFIEYECTCSSNLQFNGTSDVIISGLFPNYYNTRAYPTITGANKFKVTTSKYGGAGDHLAPSISMAGMFMGEVIITDENNTDELGKEFFCNPNQTYKVSAKSIYPEINGISLQSAINSFSIYQEGFITWSKGTRKTILVDTGHYILPAGIGSFAFGRGTTIVGTSGNPKDVIIESATGGSFENTPALIHNIYAAQMDFSFRNLTLISGRSAVLDFYAHNGNFATEFINCIFKNNTNNNGSLSLQNTVQKISFIDCVFDLKLMPDPTQNLTFDGIVRNCKFPNNCVLNFQGDNSILENCIINFNYINVVGTIRNCILTGAVDTAAVQANTSGTAKGRIYNTTIKNARIINNGEAFFVTIQPPSSQLYSVEGTWTLASVFASKPKNPSATITTLTQIT